MLSDLEPYRSTQHLIASALVLLWTAASTADIRVIDGDTLELDGETIRLWGIDAPGLVMISPGAGSS